MIGRVKPLEWTGRPGRDYISREICGHHYCVSLITQRRWVWAAYGFGAAEIYNRQTSTADAAKAACEAHWREFLFGPDGPLEAVEVSA